MNVWIIGSCPSKEQSVLEHIQVMDLILQTVSWGDLLLSIFALYALCFALHCYSHQLHLLFPCKLMLRNVFKVHLYEWTMSHKTSESVHGYNWLQQCNWFHMYEVIDWCTCKMMVHMQSHRTVYWIVISLMIIVLNGQAEKAEPLAHKTSDPSVCHWEQSALSKSFLLQLCHPNTCTYAFACGFALCCTFSGYTF